MKRSRASSCALRLLKFHGQDLISNHRRICGRHSRWDQDRVVCDPFRGTPFVSVRMFLAISHLSRSAWPPSQCLFGHTSGPALLEGKSWFPSHRRRDSHRDVPV